MATLWITEYNNIGYGAAGVPSPIAFEPAISDQTVTFTTATSSTAFAAGTKFIRLFSSADCHVVFGSSPTATASKQKLSAGVEYWRAVVAAQKVSVYDGTS